MSVKVALNVKNGSKVFKPKAGDVIIFDGKDWYITSKIDIFREYEEKMDAKLIEICEELEKIKQFKQEVSSQVINMAEIVEKFVKLQGDSEL